MGGAKKKSPIELICINIITIIIKSQVKTLQVKLNTENLEMLSFTWALSGGAVNV